VIPVSFSKGVIAARKSSCSVLVHSAHTVTEPPMCDDDAEADEADPHFDCRRSG